MNDDNMQIMLNGFREAMPKDSTIAQLIEHYKEKDKGLIVELNNKFVFPQDYGKTIIADGDKIEFINPDFGG